MLTCYQNLEMSLKNHNIFSSFCILFALCFFSCKQHKTVDPQQEHGSTKKQLIEVNRILVMKDQQRIKGHLERHNIEMRETGTGLWYALEKTGEGAKAVTGKSATINYKICLLDGTECYSSAKNGSKTFTIGRGGVETGLEEGILLMNEGGHASFIMPPHLAYGLPGDGNRIPARAIIIYDVELVSID